MREDDNNHFKRAKKVWRQDVVSDYLDPMTKGHSKCLNKKYSTKDFQDIFLMEITSAY